MAEAPLMTIPCEFPYDAERARHATLWLLKRHGHLEHIKILKLVVLADLEHLARYGRPVVGGKYFAMVHGPVASELYDDLKMNSLVGVVQTTPTIGYVVTAVQEADEDYLSETDLEVLNEINTKFGNWDTYRLSEYTHKLEFWKKHWKPYTNGSYRIPYADMLREQLKDDLLTLDFDDIRALIYENLQAEHALG
jgi:uncharacterized phage-associated protein